MTDREKNIEFRYKQKPKIREIFKIVAAIVFEVKVCAFVVQYLQI